MSSAVEFLGFAVITTGVYELAGRGWAIVTAGVLLIIVGLGLDGVSLPRLRRRKPEPKPKSPPPPEPLTNAEMDKLEAAQAANGHELTEKPRRVHTLTE